MTLLILWVSRSQIATNSESLRAWFAMPAPLPPTPIAPNRNRSLGASLDASAKYGKCPEAMIPVVPILAKRLMKVRRLEAFIFINFDS